MSCLGSRSVFALRWPAESGKAGLIRVDSTVAWIAQKDQAELQVVCSVEFVATAANPIVDRLRESGIEVTTINGKPSKGALSQAGKTLGKG